MSNQHYKLAELRQRHAKQIEWGAKSTLLGNRIAKMENDILPVWQRYIKDLGFWAFAISYSFLFWLVIGIRIWEFIYTIE